MIERGDQRGFTLLELMVALGILVFGATTLIGALSLGVGTRRGTEMRSRAVLLAGQVMHHVEQRLLAEHPLPAAGWVEDDLAIPGETVEVIDGFPGMKYSITFKTSSERPDVVLAVVRVAWRDQGEDQGQEFKRLLPRIVPLARRVDPRRNPR